ncbi:MAG: DNA polymerase Y family protein [Dongiaceae bacterium]
MTQRRIVSLWLPRFATARLLRSWPADEPAQTRARRPVRERRAGYRQPPLVTARVEAGRALVAMADARAGSAGILPGMTLADARALLPDLVVRPADPAGDAAMLAKLADWCGRYTPWTASEGEEGIWLDITGSAHLAGGEAALIADLVFHLEKFGFASEAGCADTPGAAWAAARFLAVAQRPASGGIAILPPGDQRVALAPLPVAALRIGAADAAELDRLGLRRIDDLYPLPRAALARRFGESVGRRLDQALGRCDEPLSPRRPVPRHLVRLAFPEPVIEQPAIVAALARLLPPLCRGLEAEGLGARRLVLAFYRVDGTMREVSIGTARPNRDPDTLLRLFAPQIEQIDSGFGIETVTLAASIAEPLSALQMVIGRARLDPQSNRPAAAIVAGIEAPPASSFASSSDSGGLSNLLDRLGNRIGFEQLRRLAPRESHNAERAQQRVAIHAPAAMPGWWRDHPRPLRLFDQPMPVSVSVDPDGEPVALHRGESAKPIAAVEGPERIAPEWWRPAVEGANGGNRPPRDYWRIEDEDGGRFWLCREQGGEARWLLHGLFA